VDLLRFLCKGFSLDDGQLKEHSLPSILEDIPTFGLGTAEHPVVVPLYTNFEGMQGDCHLLYTPGEHTEDGVFTYDAFTLDTVVHAPDNNPDVYSARMWHGHPRYEGRAVMVKGPFNPSLTKFRSAFYKGISAETLRAYNLLSRVVKEDQKMDSRYTLYIFPPTIKLDNAIISKNNEIPVTFTKKFSAKSSKYADLETNVTFHEIYWQFAIIGTVHNIGGTNVASDKAEEV